ncbi:hypothetical protein HPG69_006657 [Diceros bicornis minor]|uniref:Uncharacterized protein n=1 Tax=Diceros bicornis minor TaxID=77932 RepID=A0A7J7F736_DICBM|nr:hypothetical protein HPG69_006657 [Diceros bicornis minor]
MFRAEEEGDVPVSNADTYPTPSESCRLVLSTQQKFLASPQFLVLRRGEERTLALNTRSSQGTISFNFSPLLRFAMKRKQKRFLQMTLLFMVALIFLPNIGLWSLYKDKHLVKSTEPGEQQSSHDNLEGDGFSLQGNVKIAQQSHECGTGLAVGVLNLELPLYSKLCNQKTSEYTIEDVYDSKNFNEKKTVMLKQANAKSLYFLALGEHLETSLMNLVPKKQSKEFSVQPLVSRAMTLNPISEIPLITTFVFTNTGTNIIFLGDFGCLDACQANVLRQFLDMTDYGSGAVDIIQSTLHLRVLDVELSQSKIGGSTDYCLGKMTPPELI